MGGVAHGPSPALAHAARQRGATWAAAAVAGGYASAGAALVGVRRWLARGQTDLPVSQGGGETVSLHLPTEVAREARAAAKAEGVSLSAWLGAAVLRRLSEE